MERECRVSTTVVGKSLSIVRNRFLVVERVKPDNERNDNERGDNE